MTYARPSIREPFIQPELDLSQTQLSAVDSYHVSPGQSRLNGREERQGRRGAKQEVILLRQSETELYFHHFHPSRVAGPETTQWYGRETETERREARSDSNATI
ncbi:hypothetical protein J6590_016290 [Homalodisca vitripennis]|nr:hypothetical protein J6590_016290 [Homalodisca vitripennis]